MADFILAPIAQGLEHCSYKAGVDGSIPSRRTNIFSAKKGNIVPF